MSTLTDDEILSFTKLLQEPMITAACTENCGCNEVCGCKKDNCCESKCRCDSKGDMEFGLKPDDLIHDPKYRDLINAFDATKIKTIKDFHDIVTKIKSGYQP